MSNKITEIRNTDSQGKSHGFIRSILGYPGAHYCETSYFHGTLHGRFVGFFEDGSIKIITYLDMNVQTGERIELIYTDENE